MSEGGDLVEGSGLRDRVHEQMARARADLAELVSIRSVAPPRPSEGAGGGGPMIDECAEAAQWALAAFAATGLDGLRLLPGRDGCPAVYGHRPGPPGAPTVLLYAHYGVPASPVERAWQTPPWQLTERDGRWYGLGAADDKGNVIMHLTALRALAGEIPVSVKLLVDGDGNGRTDGLASMIAGDPRLLRAHAILGCDAGTAAVGEPTVTTRALDGSAYPALGAAMLEAYGAPMSTREPGDPMPSYDILAQAYPDAEVLFIGVQEPGSSGLSANESVDPGEIERLALAEALFLRRYAVTDAP